MLPGISWGLHYSTECQMLILEVKSVKEPEDDVVEARASLGGSSLGAAVICFKVATGVRGGGGGKVSGIEPHLVSIFLSGISSSELIAGAETSRFDGTVLQFDVGLLLSQVLARSPLFLIRTQTTIRLIMNNVVTPEMITNKYLGNT